MDESREDTPTSNRARRKELTQQLLTRMAEDETVRADLEDEVIRLNMVVAREVARRYEGRGVAADDLRQVAYMGLVKAVRNYDPEKATDFLSFAVPTIRGEVRRWFRDAGWMVRPPRSVQELQARLVSAQDELWQALGRAPRPTELAAHLEEDLERVIDALSANGCFAATSLDAPSRGADDTAAAIGDGMGAAEPGYARVDARVALKPLLQDLTPRERLILEMRFFRGATQAEIGKEIGVTQMQVSRLLSGIFERLRSALSDREPGQVSSAA